MNLVCTLDYESGTVVADILLRQEGDTRVVATVKPRAALPGFIKGACHLESIAGSSPLLLRRTEIAVTGQTHDGRRSELEAVLGQAELDAPLLPGDAELVTVRASLTGVPFDHRVNSRFSVSIGGYRASVAPRQQERISHVLEIADVPYREARPLIDLVDSLCRLCSFATGLRTDFAVSEVQHQGTTAHLALWRTDALRGGVGPVLYRLSAPDEITAFLDHCLPRYQARAQVFPMNNLINIGLLAKTTNYLENKALLMANFLEVIRYNYALKVGVPRGFLSQSRDNFRWVSGAQTGQRATFADILEHFFVAEGITGWTTDFTDLRNEIVHTGAVEGSFETQVRRYLDLHHFCDRIILALLEWDQTGEHYIPINETAHPDPNTFGNNWVKFVR